MDPEQPATSMVPYVLGGAAVVLAGGAAWMWYSRRQAQQAAARQAAALTSAPAAPQVGDTRVGTTVSRQALRAAPAPPAPGVTGDAAVASHPGCTPYDVNAQPVASLSPASLRHQDIWCERALLDAAWFARIQRIVTENLDAMHAPADPSLMGRVVAALMTARVPPVSNSLDQYHYLQQAARKLEVLAGHC